MKLALLKGNRFNPWHLQAFTMLGDDTQVTAFRAESEIQQHFEGRDDGSLNFAFESIAFDTQGGSVFSRLFNTLRERYLGYIPRILPFADRLEGYDLIQTWELFTDWTEQALEANARYGIPVSIMVWDNIPFNNEHTPALRARKQRALREADQFIVHTEASRRMLETEGADPARIVLIPPGVDEEHFTPNGNRATLNLPDDEFLLLFVGWMLPRKGLHFLIESLRTLVDDPALNNTAFRLGIVASGPGRDDIEALIHRLKLEDHCSFLGTYPYNEMPEVYRAADCFILPSIDTDTWQEQFGMSLIEAMACGVPVVTTRSGAIPEIAGDATILCQQKDSPALYEALRDVALNADQRQHLSAAGRARVEQSFSLRNYAQGLQQLYAGMLR